MSYVKNDILIQTVEKKIHGQVAHLELKQTQREELICFSVFPGLPVSLLGSYSSHHHVP